MDTDHIAVLMEMEYRVLCACQRYKRSHLYLHGQLQDMSETEMLGRIDFLAHHGLLHVSKSTSNPNGQNFWVKLTDKVPAGTFQMVDLLHKIHGLPVQ